MTRNKFIERREDEKLPYSVPELTLILVGPSTYGKFLYSTSEATPNIGPGS